jgi:hypothetical protein
MKYFSLPTSSVLTLVSGLLFVLFPALFFLAGLQGVFVQKAAGLSYPEFSRVNILAMIAVELAGVAVVFTTFISRSHFVFSLTVSIFVLACGAVTVVGGLAYFASWFLR